MSRSTYSSIIITHSQNSQIEWLLHKVISPDNRLTQFPFPKYLCYRLNNGSFLFVISGRSSDVRNIHDTASDTSGWFRELYHPFVESLTKMIGKWYETWNRPWNPILFIRFVIGTIAHFCKYMIPPGPAWNIWRHFKTTVSIGTQHSSSYFISVTD